MVIEEHTPVHLGSLLVVFKATRIFLVDLEVGGTRLDLFTAARAIVVKEALFGHRGRFGLLV